MSEKRCATCKWWLGFTGNWRGHCIFMRAVKYPVPVWFVKRRAITEPSDGSDCSTWEPKP